MAMEKRTIAREKKKQNKVKKPDQPIKLKTINKTKNKAKKITPKTNTYFISKFKPGEEKKPNHLG